MAKKDKTLTYVLVGGAGLAAYFLFGRKAKAAPSSGGGSVLPPADGPAPAPTQPSTGGGGSGGSGSGSSCLNAPTFPSAGLATIWKPLEIVNSTAAVMQYKEGNIGTGVFREEDGSIQDPGDYLTDYVYFDTYSKAKQIPKGCAGMVSWRPWADAWMRINKLVRDEMKKQGLAYEWKA